VSENLPARRRTLAALALPGGATSALTLAVLLGSHTLRLLAAYSPATGVDGLVVLAVTALGAALAAWLGLHLVIGTLCVLGAATGRRWRAGERLVAAHGPTLVRRGVALAVGASLGLGGLAAASAAGHLPTLGAPDLGWVPTAELEISPVDDSPADDSHAEVPSTQEAPSDGPTPDATAPGASAPEDGAVEDRVPETANADTPGTPLEGETVASEDTEPDDDARPPLPADAVPDPGARTGDGTAGTAPDATDDNGPEPPEPRTVLVEPGDSLWSLTREILSDASDVEIATAWPELYEANRELVGANPHLIQPGQELVVPTALEEQP